MVMNRREAVAAFALLIRNFSAGGSTQMAKRRPQRRPRLGRLCSNTICPNVSLDGWEVTVSHVEYAPGRVGTAHQHPGFVLAYVLEGRS